MSMSSFIVTSSSVSSSPIASKSAWMPLASGKPDNRMSVEPSSFDAASTSPVRRCPKQLKLGRAPCTRSQFFSREGKSKEDTGATWRHYFQLSTHTSHDMEAVFSTIREICGKHSGDLMKDLNVNLAFWRMFLNTTLRAAFQSRKRRWREIKKCKESFMEKNRQLFRETETLVSGQTETAGASVIDSKTWGGCRQAFCTEELFNIPQPKAYVLRLLECKRKRWIMCQ